jgi:xanthine dehydrogenase accessory factor
MGELLRRWHAALSEQSPVAMATVIEGPGIGSKLLVAPGDHVGTAGNRELDKAVVEAARGLLEGGRTETRHFGPRGQRRMEDVAVFIQSFAPPPRMYVFGAIDFACRRPHREVYGLPGDGLRRQGRVCDARAIS